MTIKIECLARAGNVNSYNIISVGFDSKKEIEELNKRTDELLNQIQKHWS